MFLTYDFKLITGKLNEGEVTNADLNEEFVTINHTKKLKLYSRRSCNLRIIILLFMN